MIHTVQSVVYFLLCGRGLVDMLLNVNSNHLRSVALIAVFK